VETSNLASSHPVIYYTQRTKDTEGCSNKV